MASRSNATYRYVVGSIFVVFVWVSYLLRVTMGIGLMHDNSGAVAPAMHYLALGVTVTLMVAVWIIARNAYDRRHPD